MSAAARVALAAETIRARWERDVKSDPQTAAAQALEDAGLLMSPEVAVELAAFRKERGLAEAVERVGALPMPVGPEPAHVAPCRWPLSPDCTCGPSVEVSADKLTRLLAPVQALREDEPATKCRCNEPDADPYACEADDCSGHFSELNPFGGSRPVNEPSAEVYRTCGCGFRTTVWHVDDGSAEEELHSHVARVHAGTAPEVSR